MTLEKGSQKYKMQQKDKYIWFKILIKVKHVKKTIKIKNTSYKSGKF